MSNVLLNKSFQGVLWTFLDVIINKIGVFVSTLIIARILGPEVYGLVGMITVFITIGNSLVDSGMSTSLIRTPNISSKDLSTVFIGALGISAVVYLVFFLFAPLIANFYKQPILENVVRVYCLVFIISAFRAVQSSMLIRELEFKKNTLLTLPAALLSSVIGIVLAKSGYGIWSVVYMFVLQQLILTILLWGYSNAKIDFSFSKEIFKKHFSFGYKLTLSGLLNTAFGNLNNVLIGRFYPVAQSGYYERAYSLNQYPATVFTAIISKVSMPVLSKIQEDKEKVEGVLKVLMRYAMLAISFIMIVMILFSREIILLILGVEWEPTVPYLQIISLGMIFLPIHMFNMNVLQVYGKSDLFLKAELIKKVFQFSCVFILYQFGILWMVSSLVFLSVFEIFVNSFFVGKVINLGVKQQVRNIWKLSLFLLIILSILYVLKFCFPLSGNPVITNILVVILLILSYFIYVFLFERRNLKEFIKIIKK